jgi:hypothetical protein
VVTAQATTAIHTATKLGSGFFVPRIDHGNTRPKKPANSRGILGNHRGDATTHPTIMVKIINCRIESCIPPDFDSEAVSRRTPIPALRTIQSATATHTAEPTSAEHSVKL